MTLRPLLILLALLPAAPPAGGAGVALRFVFTGTVTEPGGRPVRGARVVLEGPPAAAVLTDAGGAYALAHELPAVASSPSRLVLRASHRGWRFALPSGETCLALELRRVAVGDSVRLEVRANDDGAAKAVARALAAGGGAPVALEARFTRLVGREDRAEPDLSALELVTLEAPAPAAPPVASAPAERPESLRLFPGAPDRVAGSPTAAAPSVPAAPPAAVPAVTPAPAAAAPAEPVATPAHAAPPPVPVVPDTAMRPGIRVSLRANSATTSAADTVVHRETNPLRVALGRAVPAAPGSDADGCHCRVSGTVEVRSERPVRGRPRVVVSLAGAPAPRDTVEIFMGPPRPFDLGRVPCGRHELEVRVLGSRLARVAPDSLGFTCVAGGGPQLRVVLEPR